MRLLSTLSVAALALALAPQLDAKAQIASPVASQVAPQVAPLTSHRATYELSLVSGEGSKAPASASGRIAYDFFSACEGYAQTLRQAVDMQPQEGARRLTQSRTTTFESTQGKEFRFNMEVENGAVDGHAERGAKGLEVALTRPRPEKFSATPDVLFPTQHIEKVLDAARVGEKVYLARVYDGSDDGKKVYDVTAIIGPPDPKPDPDRAAQLPALQELKRWPVALSYFSVDQHDDAPEYVLSFRLYENGVSTGLKLDYGDYVLAGELTRIELLPATNCGGKESHQAGAH